MNGTPGWTLVAPSIPGFLHRRQVSDLADLMADGLS